MLNLYIAPCQYLYIACCHFLYIAILLITIAARTRDSVKDFTDYLHRKGIPYVRRDLQNPNNQGVRLTTFHGMKGLEFKHVFLTDVNQRTLPDSTDDDKKQE